MSLLGQQCSELILGGSSSELLISLTLESDGHHILTWEMGMQLTSWISQGSLEAQNQWNEYVSHRVY